MWDPEDETLEAFGAYVGDDLLGYLTVGGTKRQIVGQSELLPCIAAKTVWRRRLRGRRVVLYVDNEAARFGLIKGTSPTKDSAWLLDEFWRREAEAETNTWVERAPSACNCADHPSRGKFEVCPDLGTKARRVHLPKNFERRIFERWARAVA